MVPRAGCLKLAGACELQGMAGSLRHRNHSLCRRASEQRLHCSPCTRWTDDLRRGTARTPEALDKSKDYMPAGRVRSTDVDSGTNLSAI